MRGSGVRLWARSRLFTTLPVIDVRPLVTSDSTLAERKAVGALLHAACRDVGFFNIVGHGVPERVSSGVLSASRAWFEHTSERDKRAIALSPATGFRGYAAMGMNVTQGRPDLHEGLDFYCEQRVSGPLCGRNPWPRGDGGALAAAAQAWVGESLRLGAQLMRGIALGLALPERFFDDPAVAGDPFWVLRLIHYPPLPRGVDATPGQVSCGEHTDYGLLTLVNQESHAAALQVRNAAGDWLTPPPLPGAYVCNIGDMLTTWTNGLYPSTLHRVVHTDSSASRVSAPFFYEPSYAAVVAPLPQFGPPRFPPVVYGAHLLSKVTSNFG